MGNNMEIKEFSLLVNIQRTTVQTGWEKSKICFPLYTTKSFTIHYSKSFNKR